MKRIIKGIGSAEAVYATAVYECKTCGDTRTFLGLSCDAPHLRTPMCDGLPMEQVAYADGKPANKVSLELKNKLANNTRPWCLVNRVKGDPTKHDRRGRSPELADRGYMYRDTSENVGIEDFIDDPHYKPTKRRRTSKV